ncbi:hypothetical protein LZ016_10525 [Sphingomonas sp. SM33]|uniref:Uncharacterized protein n=1 Tax=Sphingomonas telluris TaxID=2907998 RepID=A0ABS9VP98_9SPHN|nr:hypothetical protein [Sphingomonas telluris]MCH8616533.1 hypothetical protein [Sphingomonas telluris]
MRPIYMTMAAVAGLSVAAPGSAQWAHEPTYSNTPEAPYAAQWGHSRTYSRELQLQLEAGISQGTISKRESISLREELRRLVRLERRLSPNGISGGEHAELLRRSTALDNDIRDASRPHNGFRNETANWESGSVNGHWAPDARFAGLHSGDRFDGDARIGQHIAPSMVSLPPEYRTQYIDDARVYYGYDNGRIYQIDRQSQMILALLDLPPSAR